LKKLIALAILWILALPITACEYSTSDEAKAKQGNISSNENTEKESIQKEEKIENQIYRWN